MRSYLSVRKIPIDRASLASTYAESPDPKGAKPPQGEKLYISWRVPFDKSYEGMNIRLNIIYRDLTQQEVVFPVNRRLGIVGFDVLDEKFKETNGFYTYRVALIDQKGHEIDSFKQRMWTNIISLSEDSLKSSAGLPR